MKKLLLIILMVSCLSNVKAQQQTYQRARIWLDDKPLSQLAATGIDLMECLHKQKAYVESDFNVDELRKVSSAGFRYEVLIDDVSKFYRERNKKTSNINRIQTTSCISGPQYPVPANFNYGSMGGFLTYQEMLDNLDSMSAKFPNLITVKHPASATQTTIEGNNIYYVRISDNPNVDEAEPEVLYTALHHAREPNGMSAVIYYMWYLLENYATHPDIKALVDNTEMYFIPCINVDGYMFNEMTDPFGGGMWRKNRHDYLTGVFGVDINRNYGYQWGFDDFGSSPDSTTEVYRGQSGFSEPETQIIRDFCNAHQFKLAMNYHTFSNLLINPWGYIDNFYTPDSALFENYGNLLTKYNNYSSGTGNQTVGYLVNGGSDDWMYGEQGSKPKIMSFTPEIGSADDGFWPQQSRIIPLCQENMFANLTTARLAGRYGVTKDINDRYLPSVNGYFKFDLTLLGLDTTGTYTVSIAPANPAVTVMGASKTFSSLHLLQSNIDSISYTLAATLIPGDELKFAITLDNGLYTTSDTITKIYGTPVTLISDPASATTNWNNSSAWDITPDYYVSPATSFTDSPFGNYNSNDYNEFILNNGLNLTNAVRASANFYTRWDIEKEFDYAQLLISTNNGTSWLPICGKYTNDGTSAQAFGEPIYDNKQLSWVREEIDLDPYVGNTVKFKFVMASDQFTEFDGFYFDDFLVRKIVASGVGINEVDDFVSEPYPNPADKNFTLAYQINSPATLSVYNSTGQLIFDLPLETDKTKKEIDISKLSPGVYFYYATGNKGRSNAHKLIVN